MGRPLASAVSDTLEAASGKGKPHACPQFVFFRAGGGGYSFSPFAVQVAGRDLHVIRTEW
jgi:hypothetical protein